MEKFKIFYSWQSDLPSGKTRSFIRDCIDEAIDLAQESEAIEAERDEATKDTTGSPNIVQTLFSKIDNCDLFVADISLCFSADDKNQGKVKRSPNPNVLLELGYAVKTLGWDHVICICNSDYGIEYPFDIAHNRITNYSLEGKYRNEVKNNISKIIFTNIRDLRGQPQRAKAGMASYILGFYDAEKKEVISTLKQIEIGSNEGYVLHNQVLLMDAKKLLTEIQELTNRIFSDKQKKTHDFEEKMIESYEIDEKSLNPKMEVPKIDPMLARYCNTDEMKMVWKEIDTDKKRIKQWLNVDVSEDFFDLGDMKERYYFLCPNSSMYLGSSDAKSKYNKLEELSHILMLLEIRTNYLKTFDGICFLPLAIKNNSAVADTNIRVVVKVEEGDIVEPDCHLICEEYEGLQGMLCRDEDNDKDVGVIAELFIPPEDDVIQLEYAPFNPSDFQTKIPVFTGYGFSLPEKTEEDYQEELEEFIASTGERGFYEFDVQNLRSGECKWLSYGMLIRPVNDRVKVSYRIYSEQSSGGITGELCLASD